MQLLDLGFDHWFAQHAPALQDNEERLARVCAVDRGSYRLRNETGEVPAELSGRFSHRIDRGIDLPCVGDWVGAQYYDNDKAAIIHETLPRRTFLRRKTPGRSTDHQMIAANIDTAFLVQSCHFDFNLNRLERYLLMAADGQVNPVILLTKTDLVSPQEMEQKRAAISAVTSAAIIALSSVDGSGFDELGTLLEPGRTCCLLGSSGVGKTTIINRLLGQNRHAVQTVSKTGEGTHTTTRRQLIVLDQGGIVIDTPGMRELGLAGAGSDLDAGLGELAALATACRYADCTHRHEPGCAVRAALDRGDLPHERYANYIKLKKELEFNEMSSRDKRRKDKAFGRLVKSVTRQGRG